MATRKIVHSFKPIYTRYQSLLLSFESIYQNLRTESNTSEMIRLFVPWRMKSWKSAYIRFDFKDFCCFLSSEAHNKLEVSRVFCKMVDMLFNKDAIIQKVHQAARDGSCKAAEHRRKENRSRNAGRP